MILVFFLVIINKCSEKNKPMTTEIVGMMNILDKYCRDVERMSREAVDKDAER